LAEEVQRLAAVCGCEPYRHSDPASVGAQWRTASLVLLDEPAAAAVVACGLPGRGGVLIISAGHAPDFWRAAFEVGAQQALTLPEDEAVLVEQLAATMDQAAPDRGRVLAVLGGCGGAGASILATAAALTASRRGDQCLLLDCDPLGGGLDLAVGAEKIEGLRWSGLTVSGGRVPAAALHDALPARKIGSGSLSMLCCDRDGPSSGLTVEAVQAVIAAGRRAGETVVCDLPRSLPDPAAAVLRLADLTVVVVPAEVRACAAAARLVAETRERAAGPIRMVVRGPAPGGLTIADVGRAVDLDVLAVMRPHPGLRAAVDRRGLCSGRFATRGPVGRAAGRVLAALDASAGSDVRQGGAV
jgi:secretion/DNA translocation related CpaE-like protein